MDNAEIEKIQFILEMVNRSEISSIKQVVQEILNIIKDESSSAKNLKEVIEKDPPLCAQLLKRANSAYYGYPRTISDIQEAVICIGFDAVLELALFQKVCDLFMNEELIDGYSRQSIWKHSNAVAVCCKLIYRREFRERGGDIYVAGLLHDIGIIVEDQFFQWEFKQILDKSGQEETNLYLVERELLLVNHADIGQGIAVNWDFPDELINAIGLHHEPNLVEDEFKKAVLTVYIADYICQRENIGYADAPFRDINLFHKCLSELGIKEKAIDIIVEELKEEIRKMEQMEWFK